MTTGGKASEEEDFGCGGCFLFLVLVGAAFAFAIAAFIQPVFWFVVAGIGLIGITWFYFAILWIDIYINSEEFMTAKRKIADFVRECNELNDHIRELKEFQDSIKSNTKSIGTTRDTSKFNYKRKSWKERMTGDKVHNCSKEIVARAKNDSFKYFCKYFSIKPSEQSLADFEGMLNDFSAAEEGTHYLNRKRENLVLSIVKELNPRIKQRKYKARLRAELGFDPVAFDQISFPTYTFQYISAGGNSSDHHDIVMNSDALEEFVDYLSAKVKFRKSIAGQRALMNKALRDSIKERDNFQCQACGISARNTQNLLLEIDHIKPLSKGGITCEENLQTLCWKCNRSKGTKDPT